MSEAGIFRWEVEAFAGPERERLLHGARQLLVRVRMFNGPGVVNAEDGQHHPVPDAFTDLRVDEARHLALGLLQAAEDAERQTWRANYWTQETRA
jgi:hypothetical protein